MKKIAVKIVSIAMAVAVMSCIFQTNGIEVKAAEEAISTVTFTVERFTIGEGYLVEPTTVVLQDGDTVQTVFERVMKRKSITYSVAAGETFYLKGIDNGDNGLVDIPAPISRMESYVSTYEQSGQIYETKYDAPANVKNDGNSLANNALGEGSYNAMAGWMFTVNGKGVNSAADKVKDGDVVRCQFSVYGWGADIGLSDGGSTITVLNVADKEVLTKEISKVNEKKDYLLNYPEVEAAYANALKVLTYFDAAQVAVDKALAELQAAVNAVPEETTEAETEYPKVSRVKIKSVVNNKSKKVKVSIKKISGVKGYQYRYSTKKNFKASVTKLKTTSKTNLTLKSFKKNQKCYVKVRAYKIHNGRKVFGNWSKVKSVKIRK